MAKRDVVTLNEDAPQLEVPQTGDEYKFYSSRPIDLGGNLLKNWGKVSGPIQYQSHPSFTKDTELVDKKYVDDSASGGIDWTDPVDANIVPDSDGAHNLGSAAKRFGALHTDALEMAGTTVVRIRDEDDLDSDSDVALATQQSIKAYADLVRVLTETSGFTLSVSHINREINCNTSSGFNVVLPSDGTDNLPIGFKATITQVGGGQITLDDDSGASTFEVAGDFNPKTAQKWSSVYVRKVAADTWRIDGDLEVKRGGNAQTGTSYQLAASDSGEPVTMDNGSANTVTIPDNSTVPFATWTQIPVWQKGSGVTTISAAAGVTLNGVSGGSADIGQQYHGVVLMKVGTDEWMMSGDHGAVS